MSRRWTEKEVRYLLMGLGAYGIQWFRQHAGTSSVYPNAPARSVAAVCAKIRRLSGDSKFTRGTYTLNGLALKSGYGLGHLKRGQSALNQKWKRTSPRGAHLITDEQAEEILTWLKHDYWCPSRRLYCCVQCHDNQSPPKVWGLCRRCYARVYGLVRRVRGSGGTAPKEMSDLLADIKRGRGFDWRRLRVLSKQGGVNGSR